MKKTLMLMALLGSLACAAEPVVYTWNGGDSTFYTPGNWTLNGETVSTLPGLAKDTHAGSSGWQLIDHENAYVFRIDGKVTVDAKKTPIEYEASTVELGKGSTLDTSWNFIVKRMVISQGSALSGGDGLKISSLQVDNELTSVDHDFVQHLVQNANIDFGADGKLSFEKNENQWTNLGAANRAITLSAEITLPLSGDFEISTRDLILGTNIGYRDGDNCMFDYAHSTITATNGITLRQANYVTSADADWMIDGQTYSTAQLASLGGVYRFVATNDGISIQYAAPEPATATLSLLALAALASRRKRH